MLVALSLHERLSFWKQTRPRIHLSIDPSLYVYVCVYMCVCVCVCACCTDVYIHTTPPAIMRHCGDKKSGTQKPRINCKPAWTSMRRNYKMYKKCPVSQAHISCGITVGRAVSNIYELLGLRFCSSHLLSGFVGYVWLLDWSMLDLTSGFV